MGRTWEDDGGRPGETIPEALSRLNRDGAPDDEAGEPLEAADMEAPGLPPGETLGDAYIRLRPVREALREPGGEDSPGGAPGGPGGAPGGPPEGAARPDPLADYDVIVIGTNQGWGRGWTFRTAWDNADKPKGYVAFLAHRETSVSSFDGSLTYPLDYPPRELDRVGDARPKAKRKAPRKA